jgi:hypothetical protein
MKAARNQTELEYHNKARKKQLIPTLTSHFPNYRHTPIVPYRLLHVFSQHNSRKAVCKGIVTTTELVYPICAQVCHFRGFQSDCVFSDYRLNLVKQ